jgi:hypothetical protein
MFHYSLKTMKGLLSITEHIKEKNPANFKAYLLKSTAQTSVEIEEEDPPAQPSDQIREIVKYILATKKAKSNVIINVVVQIHGYNTGENYKKDYDTAETEIAKIQVRKESEDNVVIFLGYAWPSEKMAFFNRKFIVDALKSLPGWIQVISLMGIPWIGTGLLWLGMLLLRMNTIFPENLNIFLNRQSDKIQEIWLQILNSSNSFLVFSAKFIANLLFSITALSSIVTIITLVLILLRSTVYFRDSYRATHYGVPDLIQFFKAFEYLLLDKQDPQHNPFEVNRIKLSFIGHSMGGFVTTNLVRALSDVFDSDNDDDALSIIDGERVMSKQKNSNIGRCFSLERLILISPDIPVNAILSGRSNFLRSSLSRFQESHLFSNEGDLVLLLLSTVANYISFPSTTSQMGYKLGNLGVDNEMDHVNQYITGQFPRIDTQQDDTHDVGNILGNLVIGVEHHNLIQAGHDIPFVAQEFTYFDCTNYFRSKFFPKDDKGRTTRNYKQLGILNYISLLRRLPDSHVRYFYEQDTVQAIYTIACQGFKKFQKSSIGVEILGDDHAIKVLKATEKIKYQSDNMEYEI